MRTLKLYVYEGLAALVLFGIAHVLLDRKLLRTDRNQLAHALDTQPALQKLDRFEPFWKRGCTRGCGMCRRFGETCGGA
jgi:hypothetical protein